MYDGTERLTCQVCGRPFVIVRDDDSGDEMLDARNFLDAHRRCLRRVLDEGGALARPPLHRTG